MLIKGVRSVQSVESGGVLNFVLMLWLELQILIPERIPNAVFPIRLHAQWRGLKASGGC